MDNITLMDVLQWVWQHLVQICLGLSLFVEITPIKFNPLSWLFGLLFKPLRKDMDDMKKELNKNIDSVKTDLKQEIDQIKDEQQKQQENINELIRSNDMAEIYRIRWEIIEFSNSIENAQLHIRDEYRHIIDENRRYHGLIEKYGIENGFFDEEFEKIQNHYEKNKNSTSVYF